MKLLVLCVFLIPFGLASVFLKLGGESSKFVFNLVKPSLAPSRAPPSAPEKQVYVAPLRGVERTRVEH